MSDQTSDEAAQLREENESLKRMLAEEQNNRMKLMKRFCTAMGAWVGSWDDAVVQRLNAQRAASAKEMSDAAT
jgi:hypothetical protein